MSGAGTHPQIGSRAIGSSHNPHLTVPTGADRRHATEAREDRRAGSNSGLRGALVPQAVQVLLQLLPTAGAMQGPDKPPSLPRPRILRFQLETFQILCPIRTPSIATVDSQAATVDTPLGGYSILLQQNRERKYERKQLISETGCADGKWSRLRARHACKLVARAGISAAISAATTAAAPGAEACARAAHRLCRRAGP